MITLRTHLKSIASKGGKARAKRMTKEQRKTHSEAMNKAKSIKSNTLK